MKFNIIPLRGIGDIIKFGMNRDEVRKIMKGEYRTFARGGEWGGSVPLDFYKDDGIFFNYDEEDRLEAVELARESQAVLGEIDIFSMKARAVIQHMSRLDSQVLVSGDGATSRKLSLGLWSPDLDEDPNASVESFLTGRPGYYDALFE